MQGGLYGDVTNTANVTASSGYDLFRESWLTALADNDFVRYVRDKLPMSLQEYDYYNASASLSRSPTGFQPFHYDAVTALGISMCRAGVDTDFFTGSDVHGEFATLDFLGASGQVKMTATNTRDYKTVNFVAYSSRPIQSTEENGTILDIYPTLFFQEDQWTRVDNNVLYFAGAQSSPPLDLPAISYDSNYIGRAGRVLAYILMGAAMFSSIFSLIWMILNRKSRIIMASHPFFLLLVTLGTFVMASSIIPLSFDETIVKSQGGLDVACMSVPWLYIMGFTLAASSLVAKARSVYQVRRYCVQSVRSPSIS
jgi:hypothetical protein